jgi:hypothetical protein
MTTKTKDEWAEVKNSFWKKNKIGDNIIGTLIGVREIQSQLPGKEKEMVKIYEIKADLGEFHDIDDKKNVIEEPITIAEGEIWNVGGGSKESPSVIDNQFRNIKLGQKVKIEYVDDKPAKKKGFNPMKVVKVYTNGKMDEVWLKEQEEARKNNLDNF